MKRALILLLAVAGCSSSSASPPATDSPDGGTVLPPTAACTGDPTRCIQGTLTRTAFLATPTAAKVELYRVFPTGAATPIASISLDPSGRYALSNLDPWDHYFVKAVVRFGDAQSAVSVGALRGPVAAGATADIQLLPVQLELLEISSNGARKLQYASAHLFDPGSGNELKDATVTFSSKALASVPMPYTSNGDGAKSYYASLANAPAGDSGFKVTTVHPAINNGNAIVWDMTPEAPRFAAPTLSAPKEGATVPANQPLAIAWSAATGSDYALVELFQKSGASYQPTYTSPQSLAPDTTTATVPASALAAAGAYLVNVDAAQAGCQVTPAQGCTYLLQPAGADVTAH